VVTSFFNMSPSRQTGLTLDRQVKLTGIFSPINSRVNQYRLQERNNPRLLPGAGSTARGGTVAPCHQPRFLIEPGVLRDHLPGTRHAISKERNCKNYHSVDQRTQAE